MSAFSVFAIAALCVAVAHAGYMPYPNQVTWAYSSLDVPLGHFDVLLEVPPEPPYQDKKKIMFFVGADSRRGFRGVATISAGAMLLWTPEKRWRAIAGTKSCSGNPLVDDCQLVWENEAQLDVQPGDIVFLNISTLPGNKAAGFEVSLPFKSKTTGFRTAYALDQERFSGVMASAHGEGIYWPENFPNGTTNVARVLYTTAVNPTTEIPLKWTTYGKNKWGQEFVQNDNVLTFNWQ